MKSYQFLKWATLAGLALLFAAGPVLAVGESVNVNIGALPPGKSITITYDVTVKRNLPLTTTEVSQQGTVSGANFTNVLTDDPDTVAPADRTVTLIDSIAPVAGFGSAADFNGTDAFFEVVDGGGLNSSAYTVEAWVRPRAAGAATIIVRTDAALTGRIQALYLNAAGNFVHFSNDGSDHEVTGTTTITPGRWYHVAGVVSAGTQRLYVNGAEEGTAVAGLGTISGGDRYRGAFGITGLGDNYFDGQLDELRIWSGGLSSAQLAAWMYRGADVTHPAIGQLVAGYRFDEATGSVAEDAVGTLDGTLTTSSPSPRAASTVNEWHTIDTAPVAGRFVLSDSDGTSSDGLNLAPNLVCTITGNTLGTATNADCSGFTFTPTINAHGAGTVTYKVSDGSYDSNTYTATVHVTDTTPPTAAISYSPAGPYVKGNVVTITADFSEPVADSPAMQLAIGALTGGSALSATDMTKVSTTRYTYAHTVGNGNGTASVTLATGQDAVGNPVTATPTSGGSFTVNRTATTISLASSTNPSTYGDSLTLTATVPTGATGTVDFLAGAVAISGCADVAVDAAWQAACASSSLGAGTQSLTAAYSGDDTYSASTSAALDQQIDPASLAVTADPVRKLEGDLDPALTYTHGAFVNGDTAALFTGALGRAPGETTGIYAINLGTLSAGANYTIAFTGADFTIYSHVVSSLVVDPDNPQTVTVGFVDDGIMRSTNGGVTWVNATGQPASAPIRALVIDPLDHATVYAATYGGGVAVSLDRGADWASCVNTGLTNLNTVSLAIDPAGTLYAGTEGGVFTSADCVSWMSVNTGLPDPAVNPVNSLAIDPITPATLYVGLDGAGVYKSTNSGTSWNAATTQPTNLRVKALALKDSTQLFAATYGGGVFASGDSGANWGVCATQPANTNLLSLMIDVSGKLYVGSEAGVFVSSDSCGTWTAMNNGLP